MTKCKECGIEPEVLYARDDSLYKGMAFAECPKCKKKTEKVYADINKFTAFFLNNKVRDEWNKINQQ